MKIVKLFLIIEIITLSAFCEKADNAKFITEAAKDYVQNATTGLIVFDYKKWFSKYIEKRTTLNADTCEINGCFFPEEIYINNEVSFIAPKQVKYREIDWNSFICDTSLMFSQVDKDALKIEKIGIVFSGKQVIVGGKIIEQTFLDTAYILLPSNVKLPIISNAAIHLSQNKVKEYFLWLNSAKE